MIFINRLFWTKLIICIMVPFLTGLEWIMSTNTCLWFLVESRSCFCLCDDQNEAWFVFSFSGRSSELPDLKKQTNRRTGTNPLKNIPEIFCMIMVLKWLIKTRHYFLSLRFLFSNLWDVITTKTTTRNPATAASPVKTFCKICTFWSERQKNTFTFLRFCFWLMPIFSASSLQYTLKKK